jgi:hypothetical protein
LDLRSLLDSLLAIGERDLRAYSQDLACWAKDAGFELLAVTYALPWQEPFGWRASDVRRIYRIQVRDQEGRIRSGVANVHRDWYGLADDAVQVRWDD